ncbi:REDY-like protein HapK [Sphingosinicellaceae bacterium]|nr:REDY-like protein HapK [Sphingosinicellaceae bacterium]
MRIIVLLNLKPDVTAADYEEWARTRDIPGIRSLPSVDDLTVLRTTGLLGAEGKAPYDYVEIMEVADMTGFWTDIATEASRAVAKELVQWVAGPPVFMLTEEVSTV